MAFEMQTKDDIQKRMKESFEKVSGNSTLEGTFSRDIINANSAEFQNAYAEMNLMIDAAFSDTAWGEYLTRRCAEYGIDRKPAVKATGVVTITTRAANTFIPKDTIVEVPGGQAYATTAAATTDANKTADIKIEAVEAGAKSNTARHTIKKMRLPFYGFVSVDNAEDVTGGADQETDNALRERYNIAVRTPATSGNKYHYYNWAMSIDGVGACRVIPLWNGAGTVKVSIINRDMTTADDKTIKKVADYIETVRPIGATVTVVSPAPKAVNIAANVYGSVDKNKFRADLDDYIKSQGLNLRYLSAAQVGKILMQQNISDYDNLTLNKTNKVSVSQDELLSIGSLDFTEVTG